MEALFVQLDIRVLNRQIYTPVQKKKSQTTGDSEKTETLYQQSALSHRPQEEYFQLLDPCA